MKGHRACFTGSMSFVLPVDSTFLRETASYGIITLTCSITLTEGMGTSHDRSSMYPDTEISIKHMKPQKNPVGNIAGVTAIKQNSSDTGLS